MLPSEVFRIGRTPSKMRTANSAILNMVNYIIIEVNRRLEAMPSTAYVIMGGSFDPFVFIYDRNILSDNKDFYSGKRVYDAHVNLVNQILEQLDNEVRYVAP